MNQTVKTQKWLSLTNGKGKRAIQLSRINSFEIQLRKSRTKALDAVLTKDEFFQMMKVSRDGLDRIILALGVLGLRASEIGACDASWIDLVQRTITVPSTKAKKQHRRTVPFGNIRILAEIVSAYFVLNSSVGISRIAIFERIKAIARRAGISHSVTPHGLRATGATWFAQAGYSITGLQEHFGWDSIKTAQHYITKSSASALHDMMERGCKVL